MLRTQYAGLILLAGSAGLAGCAFHRDKNPHNDVLVFATQTKLGVDISAPATSATLPAFTVGYNRSEAVWMPLRPNGPKDRPAIDALAAATATKLTTCMNDLARYITDEGRRKDTCLAAVLPADKYVSMSTGVNKNVGGSGLEIDTYSVFASFGAKGGVSGSQAGGALAQIFATGIAAQRLASNPQVGNALNTAAPNAIVKSEETKRTRIEALAPNAFNNEATSKNIAARSKLLVNLGNMSDADTKSKLPTFIDSLDISDGQKVRFKRACEKKETCIAYISDNPQQISGADPADVPS